MQSSHLQNWTCIVKVWSSVPTGCLPHDAVGSHQSVEKRKHSRMRIEIELTSGRPVWVVAFLYVGTYEGLIEGFPDDELNKRIVENCLRTARRRRNGDVPLLPYASRLDKGGHPRLPPVFSFAILRPSRLMPLSKRQPSVSRGSQLNSFPNRCFRS